MSSGLDVLRRARRSGRSVSGRYRCTKKGTCTKWRHAPQFARAVVGRFVAPQRRDYNEIMSSKTPIAAVLVATLLAGCANSMISLRSTNSPSMPPSSLPPGSSYSAGFIQADVNPGTYVSAMLIGYFLGWAQNNSRGARDGLYGRKPPELAEDRAIAERDCSQPMELPNANLRCR
jgi:hypothetical protein